jgi:hypothetical protein
MTLESASIMCAQGTPASFYHTNLATNAAAAVHY